MPRTSKRRRGTTLARTAAASALAAIAGSIATTPSASWYRRLDLPRWQPPSAAFPIVWTALYADIAVTAAGVIDALHDDDRADKARSFQRALGANLALNAGWSTVFWRIRRFDLATLEAAALTISSVDLARRAAKTDRRSGLALAPYAAWCGFATVLTATVWHRNGSDPSRKKTGR